VAKNGSELGIDVSRLAIGGDSAGGNLTAVTALMARDRGGPALRFQLMIYPVTDCAFDTPSYRENGEGYFLTGGMMHWFWEKYLADPKHGGDAYASPLRAQDVANLPPGLCITAGYDPLRDEGEAYAERLRKAGVDVRTSRYAGMFHGFFGMAAQLDKAREALAEASAALRAALA
jgi:acetyl esterase